MWTCAPARVRRRLSPKPVWTCGACAAGMEELGRLPLLFCFTQCPGCSLTFPEIFPLFWGGCKLLPLMCRDGLLFFNFYFYFGGIARAFFCSERFFFFFFKQAGKHGWLYISLGNWEAMPSSVLGGISACYSMHSADSHGERLQLFPTPMNATHVSSRTWEKQKSW